MKKTIISVAAAALCASALSVPAFAENILTDKSVYADNQQELAGYTQIWECDGEKVYVDPDTIIPIYTLDIYNYARTGNYEITPLVVIHDDGSVTDTREYIADTVDKNGDYSGTLTFFVGSEYTGNGAYSPSTDKASDSVAFELNAKRLNALMKKRGLNTDCKEVKLLWIEGVGYAYYIDNGTEKMLAAANVDRVNARIFNEENDGIVVFGNELKTAAEAELAARTAFEEELQQLRETLGPNEPLPAGGYDTPLYKVDNKPYLNDAENPPAPDKNDNPNTGGVSSALGGGIALTACVIGICAAKKKKYQ